MSSEKERIVWCCVLLASLSACRGKTRASHTDAGAIDGVFRAAGDTSARSARVRPDARRDAGVPDGQVAVNDLPLPPEDQLDALTKRLCRGDRHCCRIGASSAGTDHAGRSMTVLRLDRTCHQKRSEEDGEACQQIENWLVVHTGAKPTARQLLTEECNDGYGTSGMGEDSAETTLNAFSAGRSGGSTYYWSTSVNIVLDPLHVGAIRSSSNWRTRLNSTREETWSWDEFAGAGSLSLELCDAKDAGAPPSEQKDGDEAPARSADYVLIPEVELPPAFLAGEWKNTALGRCSVLVDGDEAGFTVHGSGTGAADASMRVVAGTDDGRLLLFVEISDDRWVGPGMPIAGHNWLHDDHLEIWVSAGPSFLDACTTREQGAPRQWAIRIADGQVFPAMGAPPESPDVERVLPSSRKGPVRLRIALPRTGEESSRITVVYSDSDDGKRQKHLIATSQVKLGWAVTLGELKTVGSACTIRNGRLDVNRPREKHEPDKALFSEF